MKQQFYKINFFLLYLIIFQKSFSSDWTRKLYKPNLTIKKDKHNAGDNLIIKNIVTSDGKVKLSYSRTSSRMISPINNSSLLEYFFKNEDGALFFCIYKNIASTLGKDKSRCYILQNYFNQFKNKKCCTIYKMAPHETCPSSEFEIFIGFKKINSSECIQALIHSSEGNFSMQAAVALFRKICIENNKNTLSIVINNHNKESYYKLRNAIQTHNNQTGESLYLAHYKPFKEEKTDTIDTVKPKSYQLSLVAEERENDEID